MNRQDSHSIHYWKQIRSQQFSQIASRRTSSTQAQFSSHTKITNFDERWCNKNALRYYKIAYYIFQCNFFCNNLHYLCINSLDIRICIRFSFIHIIRTQIFKNRLNSKFFDVTSQFWVQSFEIVKTFDVIRLWPILCSEMSKSRIGF